MTVASRTISTVVRYTSAIIFLIQGNGAGALKVDVAHTNAVTLQAACPNKSSGVLRGGGVVALRYSYVTYVTY